MEILNNIWSALNSPNEILINLLAIPATAFEYYLTMLLFIHIIKISPSFKQKIIYVTITTCISIFTMFFII